MDELAKLLGLVQTQQWEDSWVEFQRLQREGHASVRGLLLGSHAAYGRREFTEALGLVSLALTRWKREDGSKLLGQVKFHRGMVARVVGDTHVAVTMFQEFLQELYSLYPELSMGEGKAHYYLALTHWDRRDYEAAVEAAKAAVACFRRDGLPDLRRAALQASAWHLCKLNRVEEAEAYLEESEQLCRSALAHVHQTLGGAYLAAVKKEYGRSAALCEEVFRMAARNDPAAGVEEQAKAAWVAATAALGQGCLESAWALTNVAQGLAIESRNALLMNDCNQLRRMILPQRQVLSTSGEDQQEG